MKTELEQKLFTKYPKIFEGRTLPIRQNLMSFGYECGDGWYWLIDNLCSRIQSYIDLNQQHKKIPQVVATQVKEKYGGLRFYYTGGDELIDGMVWLAEDLSFNICECCGTHENVSQHKNNNWIYTRCENCKDIKYL